MRHIKKLIKMSYYQKLVVERLQRLAADGRGTLIDTGKGDLQRVYLFRGGGRLFVTAVHHATEVFGTYQSVLEALANGAHFSAVPVVNADGFDIMHSKLDTIRESFGDRQDLINCLLHGYLSEPKIERLYPHWNRWSYGIETNKKPPFIPEIEKRIKNSLVTIDIHNSIKSDYILISAPLESELQREIETLLVKVIKANGHHIREGNAPLACGFQEIRKHIYAPVHSDMTILEFAKRSGVVNIALEVPAFDSGYNLSNEARITATNVEVISRIAELLN